MIAVEGKTLNFKYKSTIATAIGFANIHATISVIYL